MTAKLHTFNGEQLTVRQIKQRVPRLCDYTIRQHLAAGRNTTATMLQYNRKAQQLAGAKRGSKHLLMQGWRLKG